MSMGEVEDITVLKDRLKSEQELVLKLKTLVIKEKKNGVNLSAEVEHLNLRLSELQQENLLLRARIEEVQRSEANGITSDLEEQLKSSQREVESRTFQLEQKNLALSKLSDELNELMRQLENGKEKERNSNLTIERLKSELTALREQRDNIKTVEKSLQGAIARENDLLGQLNEINSAYNELKESHQQRLKDFEERESETQKYLVELEQKNKELSDTLSEIRLQLSAKSASSCSDTQTTSDDATFFSVSQDGSPWDKLHFSLSALDTPTLLNICRQCLIQLMSVREIAESDVLSLKHLLNVRTQSLSARSPTDSKNEIRGESDHLVVDNVRSYICASPTGEKVHCRSDSYQGVHGLTVDSTSEFCDPLDKSCLSSPVAEGPCELGVQTNRTGDTSRLQMLEVKVSDLEKYAAEQEDRAKLQQIDWTQKLEIQAADYDHLIRDKETEISDLRETCDRLSEEVSIFSNFCSSIMMLSDEKESSLMSDEENTNWTAVADALNSSENQVSGYELSGLLETLYRKIQVRLDSAANPAVNSVHSFPGRQASMDSDDVNYEMDEIRAQLAVTVVALDDANKKASDAESTLADLRNELEKRDEKINRMKKLLIRFKVDASEQQKTKTDLKDAENTKQRLLDELEDRTREVVALTGAKEQAESALLLAREEACELRTTLHALEEERDTVLRRFGRLQSEYNAYKVKAVHTLRNANFVNPSPSLSSNSDLPARICTESTNESTGRRDPVVPSVDLEQLNHQLIIAQQHGEEASLRASLARAECDLAKEELTDIRNKYNDLLNEFRSQREIWETKLNSFAPEREQKAADRIKELEHKLVVSQSQFDEQLKSEQSRQQRLLDDERAAWSTTLDKALEENKLLQEELDNLRRNLKSYTSLMTNTKCVSPVHAPNLELSVLSPNQPRSRMQGDGADNATDESDVPFGFRSSYGPPSLQDGRHKLSTHRPIILPLDQLLNCPNTNINTVSSTGSSLDSPHVSRRHNGSDVDGDDALASSGAASQIAGLRVALNNQQRRVEHLSELLNESEANVARLEEQAKVLKEEIRRLERITIRESQFALPDPTEAGTGDQTNPTAESADKDAHYRTEYLKNVILKLICSAPDSVERPHLVSVLSSLLMLSATEQKSLQDGILSTHRNVHPSTKTSSWTAYLTGWASSSG